MEKSNISAWDAMMANVAGQPEIDRLRAENAAMRAIVKALASSNPYGSWYPAVNSPAGVVCRWCMERALPPQECQHDHECTWRQACAFIAAMEQ